MTTDNSRFAQALMGPPAEAGTDDSAGNLQEFLYGNRIGGETNEFLADAASFYHQDLGLGQKEASASRVASTALYGGLGFGAVGAGTGALAGAITAKPGERREGARRGAIAGAATGAAAGTGFGAWAGKRMGSLAADADKIPMFAFTESARQEALAAQKALSENANAFVRKAAPAAGASLLAPVATGGVAGATTRRTNPYSAKEANVLTNTKDLRTSKANISDDLDSSREAYERKKKRLLPSSVRRKMKRDRELNDQATQQTRPEEARSFHRAQLQSVLAKTAMQKAAKFKSREDAEAYLKATEPGSWRNARRERTKAYFFGPLSAGHTDQKRLKAKHYLETGKNYKDLSKAERREFRQLPPKKPKGVKTSAIFLSKDSPEMKEISREGRKGLVRARERALARSQKGGVSGWLGKRSVKSLDREISDIDNYLKTAAIDPKNLAAKAVLPLGVGAIGGIGTYRRAKALSDTLDSNSEELDQLKGFAKLKSEAQQAAAKNPGGAAFFGTLGPALAAIPIQQAGIKAFRR